MKQPRAIADAQALCALQLPAEVLVPAVLEALHAVVPSYRNLFDWADEQGRLLRYFIEGPIDAGIAQLYFDEFHNRREAEVMPRFDTLVRHPRGVRSAQELDHAAFFRSALYNEIWRPQGFHTRLEAVVRGTAGQLVGSLVLYRAAGAPRFTLHDERQLAAVLPALGEGLQAAGRAARAGTGDRQVPSPDPPESLLLTLQGQISHASAGAHRLLLMAEGGAARHSLCKPLDQLAGGLLSLLLARLQVQWRAPLPAQAHAAEAGTQQTLQTPASITCETAAGAFVASGVLLRPLHGGGAPMVQVTLRRLEPHRVALERALRALPLTAGQTAVCRQLLLGHTHSQIGQALGVAETTVVDHVRKLYRALDLRSALDLRALMDARVARAQQLPA